MVPEKIRVRSPALVSLLCGLVCFAIDFLLIPALCLGWPDWLWMSLSLLLPVGATVLLWDRLGGGAAAWVFLTVPVQALLLWLLAEPVAGLYGVSLSGLGGFEYLGRVGLWPPAVALTAFVALKLKRRVTR